MKTITLIPLMLLSLILFAGCTSQDNNDNLNDTDSINSSDPINITPSTANLTTKGDLIPMIFTATLYPDINEEIKITARVQNLGVERITQEFDYHLTLSKDSTILYEKTGTKKQLMLPTNEIDLHTFNYTFDSYGQYRINLSVDTNNMVAELKENNNQKSVKIVVKEAVEEEEEEQEAETGLGDYEAKQIAKATGCYDSDGGLDYDSYGICYDTTSFEEGRSDSCSDDETLVEMYCDAEDRCNLEIKECSGMCEEGECI